MRAASLLLITLAAVACSSSSDNGGTPGGSTGGTTVGANGGTVTSDDGNVQLVIPAGALSKSVSVSIVKDTATAAAGGALVPGSVYDFEPSGTTFAVPATLRIPYQPSALRVGTDQLFLSVYLRDGAGWDSIPSTLDIAAHVVTAAISHFSQYGLCSGPCLLLPLGSFIRIGFYPGCCATLPAGGQITADGVIQWNNSVAEGTVTLGPLPTGVTGVVAVGPTSAGCPSICDAPITVTLSAALDAPPGRADINVGAMTSQELPVNGLNTIHLVVTAVPGFALSTSPPSLPLAQGGSATATVSITRTNFTPAVTLSTTGLPTGVTAAFSPATLTGAALSSTVTFTATGVVPAGAAKVVVKGTGAGAVDQADTVTLVVAAFAIAAGPASGSAQAGGSATFGVKATRAGGFNTAIAYAVTGLPTGAIATFASTSVADSSKLTIAVGAGVTTGLYALEITGTAGSVTQQTPVSLVVTSSSGGLRLDFSGCATPPIWLAVQDSTGPWTQVIGSNGVFQLPLPASQHVGLASVAQTGGTFATGVQYLSASELADLATVGPHCIGANQTPQTLAGTVIGTDSVGGAFAFLSMGGGSSAARSDGPFSVASPPGAHDVIGYLERTESAISDSDKFVITRNVTTPGTINFNTGTTVAMATASVQGGSPGDFFGVTMFYASHACEQNEMYAVSSTLPTFPITGVPASLQLAGDLHVLFVSDFSGNLERDVTTMFHTLAPVTPALGTPIAPIVTVVTSPYKRLSVSLPSLPPEYATLFVNGVSHSGGPGESFIATRNYLGNGTVNVTMPDLSAVAGFSSAWEPSSSATLNSMAQATSMPYGQQACSDGLMIKTTSVVGTN